MKKLISLLGILSLSSTASLSVVACGEKPVSPDSNKPTDEQLLYWTKKSSNAAKAVIVAQEQHFNTNQTLIDTLNSDQEKTIIPNPEGAGDSYQSFINSWGFDNKIESNFLNKSSFNSNNTNTSDNQANEIASKISATIKSITDTFSLVKSRIVKPESMYTTLNSDIVKKLVAKKIGDFFEQNKIDKSIAQLIKNEEPLIIDQLSSSVALIGNSMGKFDPNTINEEDKIFYNNNDSVVKVLFDNAGGWLNNSLISSQSDALKIETYLKNSNLFKGDEQQKIDQWDQFALFKSGLTLNEILKSLSSDGQTSISTVLNKNISWNADNTAIASFNSQQFIKDLGNLLKTVFNNINGNKKLDFIISLPELIESLVTIVKYNFFGFKPTEAVKTISTTEKTNVNTGNVNIAEVLQKIGDILTNKNSFTSFFTNLFFPDENNNLTLANYASLDFVLTPIPETNFPAIDKMVGVKDQIIGDLENAFDSTIKIVLNHLFITQTIEKLVDYLNGLGEKGFTINFDNFNQLGNFLSNKNDELKNLLNFILDSIGDNSATTAANLTKNWSNETFKDSFLANLGFDSNHSYRLNSLLGSAKQVLDDDSGKQITNIFSVIKNFISGDNNPLEQVIKNERLQLVDLNDVNKYWVIDDKNINLTYDQVTSDPIIKYEITSNINGVTKKYEIIIAFNQNINQTDTKLKLMFKEINLIN